MQATQRRRWRLAKLLPVGAGHPAQMGEAEIEGDVDDARIRRRALEPRVEMREPKLEQHLRDRHSEMAAEAELQRANADAGGLGKRREIERLGGAGFDMIPRA